MSTAAPSRKIGPGPAQERREDRPRRTGPGNTETTPMTTRSRRHPRVPGLLLLVLLPPFGLAGCAPSPSGPAGSDAETPPARAKTLADAVASARPGDTIVLPAGTLPGGITLPPRGGLRGAGCRRTIIRARTFARRQSIQ